LQGRREGEKGSGKDPPLLDLASTPRNSKKRKKNPNQKHPAGAAAAAGKKKETKLGLSAPKATNFSDWYTEALLASEMVSYYDVSGCYILRPWSFAVWESITAWFDAKIKALGVKNAYFPLFITEDRLNTEKDHVEGVCRRRRFGFFFLSFFFLRGVEGVSTFSLKNSRPLSFSPPLSFSLSLSRKTPVLRRGRVGDKIRQVGARPPDSDPPDLGDRDVSFFSILKTFPKEFPPSFLLLPSSSHAPFSPPFSFLFSPLPPFSQVPLLRQLGPLVARPPPAAQPVDKRREVGVQAPDAVHPHAGVPVAGGPHRLRVPQGGRGRGPRDLEPLREGVHGPAGGAGDRGAQVRGGEVCRSPVHDFGRGNDFVFQMFF